MYFNCGKLPKPWSRSLADTKLNHTAALTFSSTNTGQLRMIFLEALPELRGAHIQEQINPAEILKTLAFS